VSNVNHAPVLLVGPSSTGKTSLCKDALISAQIPYAFVDCKTYSNERGVMESIGIQWKQWLADSDQLDMVQRPAIEPTSIPQKLVPSISFKGSATESTLFSPISGEENTDVEREINAFTRTLSDENAVLADLSSATPSTVRVDGKKPFDIHKFISNGYESLEYVTLFPSAFIVLKHAHILPSLSKLTSVLSSTLLSTLSLASSSRYAQIGLIVIEQQASVHENTPLSTAINNSGRPPITIHFPPYDSASLSDILVHQIRESIPTTISSMLTNIQIAYLLQALIDVLSHLTHNPSVLFNALRRLLNEPSCCEAIMRAKSIRSSSRELQSDLDHMEDLIENVDKDLVATIMHLLQPVIRKLYENLLYLDKQFSFHPPSRGFSFPNGTNSKSSSASNFRVLPFSPKMNEKSSSNVWCALPQSARFLLLAAYICGFNPPATDLIIFTQNLKKRKRRRTATVSSANDTDRQSEPSLETQNMSKLGGSLQSFPLERLLAILDFIWETKSSRCEIYVQIASLTSLHFIQRSRRTQTTSHATKKVHVPDTPGLGASISSRSTRSDTLTDIRFVCTISLDVALEVAKSCDVNLKAYLHEVVT
jgi:Cdc6-like AAA superfamily ATPase